MLVASVKDVLTGLLGYDNAYIGPFGHSVTMGWMFSWVYKAEMMPIQVQLNILVMLDGGNGPCPHTLHSFSV